MSQLVGSVAHVFEIRLPRQFNFVRLSSCPDSGLLGDNDDEAEKAQGKKKKKLEARRTSISTPAKAK